MNKLITLFVLVAITATPSDGLAANISTVRIGDPGNPSDPVTGRVSGRVDHVYRIGATEVTNTQYAEFLNEKAKSDSLGLYSVLMGRERYGGITQSGVSGSFTYAIKPNMADKPANYLSWYDSIRFVNWLNNGQGSGDTETGAYTILGGTQTPSNGNSITRNPGATWFLPNDNEWYKAAYYQPAGQGGDSDNYWRYATRSNTVPTHAIADTAGNITNPGPNVVNYRIGFNDNVTTVGSAGPLSMGYYGTVDQAGNIAEWDEGLFNGSFRDVRGGSFNGNDSDLRAEDTAIFDPTSTYNYLGFRVATIPEPSSLALAAFGFAGLAAWGWRRKR